MSVVLFNFHDVVLLSTVLCCCVCVLMLWQWDRSYRGFNYFALAFFVASACIPLDTLFNFGEAFRPWALAHLPGTFFVFEYGAWIQAPLAYWMLKCLLIKKFEFTRYDLLLALPFVVALTHQVVVYHTLSTDQKLTIQSSVGISSGEISIYFVQVARDVFRCVIAWYCLSLVRKYLHATHVSALAGSVFHSGAWLLVLGAGFLLINAITALIALCLLIYVKFGVDLPFATLGLTNNYLVFVYFAAIIVVYSRGGLPVHELRPISEAVSSSSKMKPVNPMHVQALDEVMNKNRAYKDADLTLEALAEQVGVSPRTLSSIINMYHGCHFFEYINRHRIVDAKKLLEDPVYSKLSVLEIMHEAGFSSKATFNGFFKKIEGVTPSEYRRSFIR